ncbi:MAG TPA: membrane protein insertase YidC [Bacteroidales bacterium]|jgi:YidC/Oxa1 family membrane protein insertase|nr:membrane protein insertase YidC [Bacteroidales bacterium]HNV95287.1 membrane protein insertase YidC [Bacteroidales bacterium]
MNKNTVIGIFLIFAIFVVFGIINKPSEEELAKAKQKRDSLEQVYQDSLAQVALKNQVAKTQEIVEKDSLALPDSIVKKQLQEKYGQLSQAAIGDSSFFVLENNKLKITFTNKGGRPYKVELKEYKTFDSLPVVLWQGDSVQFGLNFFAQNRSIQTQNFYFKALTSDSIIEVKDKAQKIAFRLEAGENRYIDFIYELDPNSYKLNFSIKSKNIQELTGDKLDYMVLDWKLYAPQLEKNADFETTNTTVYYKYDADEVDYLSETKDVKEDLKTKVKWVAFKQQFFSSVLMAKEPFLNATVESKKYNGRNKRLLKELNSELTLNYEAKSDENKDYVFYFGPNHFHTLKEQNIPDLEKLIPLGWGIFGWINRFIVIPVFNFFDNFIGSYGIIILLLTILLKIILFPLTYKSYMATAKMRVLKPQVDEINAKIPKDKPLERQQATMALYKKAGVNPMGGCLPMLLQMPILFAMFRFFPTSFELRQQSFLWATDLSSYDSIWDFGFNVPFYGDHMSLFCLLMTASTIIYTYQQNKMNPQNSTMPSMKVISYMMPIMFLFIFNNYSAGLSYYYFLANVFTFGQMYVIRRFVNEEKLLAQINENKKKPVKKSRFQERLEEMTRQRQQMNKKK